MRPGVECQVFRPNNRGARLPSRIACLSFAVRSSGRSALDVLDKAGIEVCSAACQPLSYPGGEAEGSASGQRETGSPTPVGPGQTLAFSTLYSLPHGDPFSHDCALHDLPPFVVSRLPEYRLTDREQPLDPVLNMA